MNKSIAIVGVVALAALGGFIIYDRSKKKEPKRVK